MWPFSRGKNKNRDPDQKSGRCEAGGPYRTRDAQYDDSRIITTIQPFEFSFECEDGPVLIGHVDFTIEINPDVFEYDAAAAGARMRMESIGSVCNALRRKTSKQVFVQGSNAVCDKLMARLDGRKCRYLRGLRVSSMSPVEFRIAADGEHLPRYQISRIRMLGDHVPEYCISM